MILPGLYCRIPMRRRVFTSVVMALVPGLLPVRAQTQSSTPREQPDDAIALTTSKEPRRSRQNVIFELGFFFAQLGRRSGRVIVLHKGPNELPSDIHGVVWIGIDHGVDAAGEEIRREVAQFEAHA